MPETRNQLRRYPPTRSVGRRFPERRARPPIAATGCWSFALIPVYPSCLIHRPRVIPSEPMHNRIFPNLCPIEPDIPVNSGDGAVAQSCAVAKLASLPVIPRPPARAPSPKRLGFAQAGVLLRPSTHPPRSVAASVAMPHACRISSDPCRFAQTRNQGAPCRPSVRSTTRLSG